ncbi:uncharacterized protein L3040_007472 [Drepanopeziza brunnea f. sp. 'multigermtubi']|nr:hypothetical protein L3040_007472 [Drepanopeziza brunnea f. sp. 'multigermtubi']
MPSGSSERAGTGSYDTWSKNELELECEKRGLSKSGHVAVLVQRVVMDDISKHEYCGPTDCFTKENDPDGSIENARVDADAKFDYHCQSIMSKAWQNYYEGMLEIERTKSYTTAKDIFDSTRDREAEISHKVGGYAGQNLHPSKKEAAMPQPATTLTSRKPQSRKSAASSEPGTKLKSGSLTAKGLAVVEVMNDNIAKSTAPAQHPSNTESRTAERSLQSNSATYTSPVHVPGSGPKSDLIESLPVPFSLESTGYVFLACADTNKIRGDYVARLKAEYRSVPQAHADKSGYYLVFEDTVEGHVALSDCYEVIYDEVLRGVFFDKNVIDVKLFNWKKPEKEVLEEVHLGYTHVPYPKERRSRVAWNRGRQVL